MEDLPNVAKLKNVSRTLKQYITPELNIDSLPAMEEWLKK